MNINCSHCNSNYSISDREAQGLNQSILTCKKCKRFIKITFCPRCRAFYSITFATVDQAQYNFRCKRCMSSFVVDFSPVMGAEVQEKGFVRENSKTVAPEQDPVPDNFFDKTGKTGRNDEEVGAEEKKDTAIVFRSRTFSALNIKELFAISFMAFTPMKIFISSMGVLFIAAALSLFSGLESMIFSADVIREYPYLRSLFSLFPAAIAFFLFILTAAVVSKNTLEKLFHDRGYGLERSLGFALKVSGPVFISNVLILVLMNSLFVLFSSIPVIGPLLFSLLFLPLYAASFMIFTIMLLGFWFYPPIIAHRDTGIVANVRNFYHFIKKHNLVLLYVVPILGIATALIFSGIYFFHYCSLSLAVLFARGFSGENMGKIFSSIPSTMLKLTEPSLFGADMGLFKSLMNGIEVSHSIGGMVLGIALALISVLLLGSFISVISTLSTHIYILMERGVDVDDSRKIRLLALLVLVLTAIFLFKNIFVRM